MTPLSTQDVLDAIKAERRRRAIRTLASGGTLTLRELSERVAEAQYGAGYERKERKRVYITLYQCHLPAMEEQGLIEWDGSSNDEITATRRVDSVLDVLNAIENARRETNSTSAIGRVISAVTGTEGDGL